MAFDMASAQKVEVPDEVGLDPNTPPAAGEAVTPVEDAAPAQPRGFDLSSAQKVILPDEAIYHQPSNQTIGMPPGLDGHEAEYLAQTQVQGRDKSDFMGTVDLGLGYAKKVTDALSSADPFAIARNLPPVADTVGGAAKGLAEGVIGAGTRVVGGTMTQGAETGAANVASHAETEINFLKSLPLPKMFHDFIDENSEDFIGVSKAMSQGNAALGQGIIQSGQDFIKEHGLERPEGAAGLAYDVSAGTPTMAAAMGLAYLTRNPAAAGLVFGKQQMSDTYMQARAKGFSPETADLMSNVTGATTAALTSVGSGIFMSLGGESSAFTKVGMRVLDDAVTMGGMTAANTAENQAFGLTDLTKAQAAKEIGYAAFLGGVFGLGGGGIAHLLEKPMAAHGFTPEQVAVMGEHLASNPDLTHQAFVDTSKNLTAKVAANPEAAKATAEIIRKFQKGEPVTPDVNLPPVPERTAEAPEAAKPAAEAAPEVVPAEKAAEHGFQTGKPVTVEGFHGTREGGFETFDPSKRGEDATIAADGLYFTDSRDNAATYSNTPADATIIPDQERYNKGHKQAGIYHSEITFNNPLVVDFSGHQYDGMNLKTGEIDQESIDDIVARARRDGHDGVIAKNISDEGRFGKGVRAGKLTYITFDHNNIRSAKSPKSGASAPEPTPEELTAKQIQISRIDRQIDELASQHEENPTEATQAQLDDLLAQREALGDDVQFSRAQPSGVNSGLGFRSQAADIAEQKLPNSGTGEQHLQNLEAYARNGDIKPEELEWSGVREWLGSQDGKVSKAEVADFLRQGGVKLEEVTKGQDIRKPNLREAYNYIVHNEGILQEEALTKYGSEDAVIEHVYNEIKDDPYSREPYDEGQTKFEKFTLPGGTNYREVLLTLPENKTAMELPQGWEIEWIKQNGDKVYRSANHETKQFSPYFDNEQQAINYAARGSGGEKNYKSSHYDEPNILAHIRLNDRTDADGKKVLFIEEIQSDWHQAGRKSGYKNPEEEKRKTIERENSRAEYKNLVDNVKVEFEERLKKAGLSDDERANVLENQPPIKMAQVIGREDEFKAAVQRMSDANEYVSKAVPDAPFKKTWQDLALKRILAMATDGGYDKVAWTTGEQQAERYDLSKQVERVIVAKEGDKFRVFARDLQGKNHDMGAMAADALPEAVGKDLAKKIIEQKKDSETYEGTDLKVGGEGMKGFYDQILPTAMNNLVKKWGGKTEKTSLGTSSPDEKFDVYEKKPGVWYIKDLSDQGRLEDTWYRSEDEANAAVEKEGGFGGEGVHSVELTPAIKDGVSAGLPLFQRGEGEAPADAQHITRGLVGVDKGKVTTAEQDLIDAVGNEIKRLAPFAENKPSRHLFATEESGAAGRVVGAAQFKLNGGDYKYLLHWALETADQVGVARHEALHILRRAGLFSNAEWQALTDMVHREGLVDKVSRLYTPEQRVEEAIANKVQAWRRSGKQDASLTGRLLHRIDTLLSRIGEISRQIFGKDATAEDVLARIERGEVGKRYHAPRGMAENEMPAYLRAGKVITQGRLKRLDEQVRDHDNLIAKSVSALRKAENEGRSTVALQKRVNKLDAERDVMDKERGDILTTERAAEQKFLEARTQDKQVQVKGATIQRLSDEENARGLMAGLRQGKMLAKTDTRAAQEQVIEMLDKSGLVPKDKAKFIRAIKNIQTPEQLAREMGILQSRVARLLNAAQRRAVRNDLVKTLKRTKPTAQGGKPRGKYTPEVQEALDALRASARLTAEQAGERLKAFNDKFAESNDVPDPIEALQARLLATLSDSDDARLADMQKTLADVRGLVDEGRAGGLAREIERKARLTALKDEALAELQSGGDRSTLDRTTTGYKLREKAKAARGEFYKAYQDWQGTLKLIFSDEKTPAGKLFHERLGNEVSSLFQKQKGTARLQTEALLKHGMDAYGLTKPKQFFTKMAEDERTQSLGLFKDANGKEVRLQMSKAEARKRWMEQQDPTLVDTLTNERGNAYTADMLQAINDSLTPEDKAYARAQMGEYRKFYDQVNAVYSRAYGINLPFNEFYTPISREHNTESPADSMLKQIQFVRSVAPGGLKSRVRNVQPLKQMSDVATYQRHIMEMSHFIHFAEKMQELNAVFGDKSVRNEISDRFGKQVMGNVDAYIGDFTRGYLQQVDNYAWLEKLRTNFAKSVLGLKPALAAKQAVQSLAYAEFVPAKEYAKGLADFASHPVEAARILNQSELMKARGSDMERDVHEALKSKEFIAFQKVPSFTNLTMLPIQLGDKAAVLTGGWAVYKYNRDVLGKSHDEALRAFENATAKTQQSSDLDQLTRLQASGSTFARAATMFMSGQNQFLRREVNAFVDASRGNISKADLAKKVALYHFVLPMVYQWVANAGYFDASDELRAGALGSLNGMFLVYDVLNGAMRAMAGERQDVRGMGVNPFEFMKHIGAAIQKLGAAGEDITMEDLLDASADLAKGIGNLTGLPVDQAFSIGEGIGKINDGQAAAGTAQVAGFPRSVAKKLESDE